MSQTKYGVQIVGTNALDVMTDPDKLERYITKLLEATAKTIYEKVQQKIGQVRFKNSTGTINRALRWESGDGWAAVFMDDAIAPYAVNVERGVRPHTMRYLLKATSAIPLQIGTAKIFRRATEKWMGRPHPSVDPHSGLVFMTKGWQHPGYEGKFFMRDGFLEAVQEAQQRAPMFVFRLFEFGEAAAGDTL